MDLRILWLLTLFATVIAAVHITPSTVNGNETNSIEESATREDTETLKRRNKELSDQLRNATIEKQLLADENVALTKQVASLKSHNNTIKAENDRLKIEVKNLTAENDHLFRYIFDYITTMKKIKDKATGVQKSIQLLSVEMGRLRSVEKQLKQELDISKNTTERLRKENAKLKGDNRIYI